MRKLFDDDAEENEITFFYLGDESTKILLLLCCSHRLMKCFKIHSYNLHHKSSCCVGNTEKKLINLGWANEFFYADLDVSCCCSFFYYIISIFLLLGIVRDLLDFLLKVKDHHEVYTIRLMWKSIELKKFPFLHTNAPPEREREKNSLFIVPIHFNWISLYMPWEIIWLQRIRFLSITFSSLLFSLCVVVLVVYFTLSCSFDVKLIKFFHYIKWILYLVELSLLLHLSD